MKSENITVREACRRRKPLDGVDAESLEHALTITERERDAAVVANAGLRSPACPSCGNTPFDSPRDSCSTCFGTGRVSIQAREDALVLEAVTATRDQCDSEAAAAIEQLQTALREQLIDEDDDGWRWCKKCRADWLSGEPERHDPGCLAVIIEKGDGA